MKRIFEKVKDVVTLQLLRNELTTSVRDEGKAVRDCIYEQFSRLFNDRDTNKEVVNQMVSLLAVPANEDEAKQITKKSLLQIEIEVFSFCNRKCWFCPNSYIDRSSDNKFMSEEVYLKILSELKKINYGNTITFSRYNEPLADEIIVKRIEQARKYCPDAFIRTNTNGDYLTQQLLEKLIDAGLNEMEIQCYYGKGEKLTRESFEKKLSNILSRISLTEYELGYCNEVEGINATILHDKIHLTFAARNFNEIATNRGESLSETKSYHRETNCLIPFKNLYIDYNGSYMLCCNLRSDIEKHEHFIIGNAKNDSIFDVFTGPKMIEMRKKVGKNGILPSPCSSCNFLIEDKILRIGR